MGSGSTATITEEMYRASLLSAVEDKIRRRLREVFDQAQVTVDRLMFSSSICSSRCCWWYKNIIYTVSHPTLCSIDLWLYIAVMFCIIKFKSILGTCSRFITVFVRTVTVNRKIVINNTVRSRRTDVVCWEFISVSLSAVPLDYRFSFSELICVEKVNIEGYSNSL